MKALVTGATGFIGAAVARAALAADMDVRLLVRSGADRRNVDALEAADAKVVLGDLTDHDSLQRAVAGCDALFHVAADYRLWTPDPESMYATNVEGTEALMRAALDAGVARIVYTSSVATIGLEGAAPADETAIATLDDMVGHYKRSKFLAEQRVMQLVDTHHAPIVIVNPSAPVGPGDVKPTPTGKTISDIVHGRMPAYVDTGLNIVHVDDVAQGHILALERGIAGRRYILGGEDMTLREIILEVCALTSRSPPRIKLPYRLVLPIAYILEAWARISGKPPRAPVEGVRLARKKMFFSSARAIDELGYRARPASEAIAAAVEWFECSRVSG